jgi:phosphoribosylformylglycinamidine (FGAM) synthase-like enzyme
MINKKYVKKFLLQITQLNFKEFKHIDYYFSIFLNNFPIELESKIFHYLDGEHTEYKKSTHFFNILKNSLNILENKLLNSTLFKNIYNEKFVIENNDFISPCYNGNFFK